MILLFACVALVLLSSSNKSFGNIEAGVIYYDNKSVPLRDLGISAFDVSEGELMVVELDENGNAVKAQSYSEHRAERTIDIIIFALIFAAFIIIPTFLLRTNKYIKAWNEWARDVDNLKKFAKEDEMWKMFSQGRCYPFLIMRISNKNGTMTTKVIVPLYFLIVFFIVLRTHPQFREALH